jgi:DNA-binding transcriptional LysR family regulator
LLERGLSATLFQRIGRGVVAAEAALAFTPHAQQALEAVNQGSQAVAAAGSAVTVTIRFGLSGAAHLYLGSRLVADVRKRFPPLGWRSSDRTRWRSSTGCVEGD